MRARTGIYRVLIILMRLLGLHIHSYLLVLLPGEDNPTAQRGRLRREGTDCEHSLRGRAQVHPAPRLRGLSQPGERGPPRGHSHPRGDAAPQLRVGPPAGQLLGQAGLGRRDEPRGAVEPRAMAHQGSFQVPTGNIQRIFSKVFCNQCCGS